MSGRPPARHRRTAGLRAVGIRLRTADRAGMMLAVEPSSPLAKKLKLNAGARAAVVGAPPGYLGLLSPPAGLSIAETLDRPLDWIQVFVRTSAELAAIVRPLTAALAPGGLAWISYPKGTSKLQTDLTRDRGWEPLADGDLMWLSLVSVDATWSAFGLRPYKLGEARQTFR